VWAGHFEIEEREDDRGKLNQRWRDMRQRSPKIASPETILLVDDDEEVRSIMARALSADGYHVVEASDAAMALSALNTRPEIQLLVADIVMPDLSGFDLASQVIADHNLPILLISSGQVQTESDVPGPLLQKPFTTEALLEAVRSLLPVTRPALKLPIWHPGGPTPFDDESNSGP
jgi:DNA-binding response OmpR family regulator